MSFLQEKTHAEPTIGVHEKSTPSSSHASHDLSGEPRSLDPKAESRLLLKCDLNIMPILFVLYMFSFLDRINIGNARIQGLMKDLHMTTTDYNLALLIFFVPYILLEVPANIILKNIRPSTWISFLGFFWGIATLCQGVVKTKGQLIACRVLMGIFEAGMLPGCIYLISMYYKRHEFQKRMTVFYASTFLAGAFGGLLAFAFAKLNGKGGLAGWRWIFILEGAITIFIAIIAKFLVVDWPQQCKFLSPEEKKLLDERLAIDKGSEWCKMDVLDKFSAKLCFLDWKVWCAAFMYIFVATSGYSTSFFIPTILNEFGYAPTDAQLHTVPIYVCCTGVSLTTAWLSDRLRHRYGFLMLGIGIASIGYIILLCQAGLPRDVKYMACFFLVTGIYVTQPMVIVWLANNLAGHYKRAIGSAMQISIGNVAGIIGSNIFLDKEKPLYKTGFSVGFSFLLMCGVLSTVMFFGLKWENKKKANGERDYLLQLPKEQSENLGDSHPSFRYAL